MTSAENVRRGLDLFQAGQRLQEARDLAAAAAAFAQAYRLLPEHPPLLAAYAALAEQVRDWSAAEKLYRRLGTLRPDANFEGRLGLCLFRLERYEEAIPFLQTHLARYPEEAAVQLPLAQSLLKTLRWEEALAIGRRLLAGKRNEVHVELVLNCLVNLGMKDEIDAIIEDILRDFPASAVILALCGMHLLKSFDHRRGFALQPAIRRRYQSHKPDARLPPAAGWDGKPFDGVLLVDGEQGLGEEILCASMYGDLVALGQRAIIAADPRLIPLFQRSFPGLEFVSRYGDSHDRCMQEGGRYLRFPALDLACIFRRGPFRHSKPWLVADPQRVAALRARYMDKYPGKRLKGISWRTVRDATGHPRSIQLVELAELFRQPDIAWLNVQYGDYSADIAALAALGLEPPWDDLSVDQTNDIDGLAAQLCAFDSLVSISNTTVHMAGALGVDAHLMLPKSRPVIWYWGYEGDHTPWYPSITIHRNKREDDWHDFAIELARDLRENRR